MVTIPLKARLQADGTLNIRVPTGMPESEVEVVLLIEPVATPLDKWPDDFFESTFAAFSQEALDRPEQEPLETREALH
jgi:hypothetical protein